MSRQMLFVWIDDDPQREKVAQNYEVLGKVRIRFFSVKDKDLAGC